MADLVAVDTVSPLEGGTSAGMPDALDLVESYAVVRGFEVVERVVPGPGLLAGAPIPVAVEEAAAAEGPDFWRRQPSLVLAVGPASESEPEPESDDAHATGPTPVVMLNAHLDTVGPYEPPVWEGRRLWGRGATDAKGGAVAALAALAHVAGEHDLTGRAVVQLVSGEEGGAMGVYGTRLLTARGHRGTLNVFVEPTGDRAVGSSGASMTLAVEVDGDDASDDTPGAGHNATVVLGAVAEGLVEAGRSLAADGDVRLCVAGLHTGTMHNRVYGRGRLLVNVGYYRNARRETVARELEQAVDRVLDGFRSTHAGNPLLDRTLDDLDTVVRLRWLKRGLPVLEPPPPGGPLRALVERHAGPVATDPDSSLVCDAIWADHGDGLTVVWGPGSIAGNHCHAAGELADLDELESYTRRLSGLLADLLASGAASVSWMSRPGATSS